MPDSDLKPPPRRQESRVFTIWVHAGYIVLILSMVSWMVYIEYILD
ncbi:MAG: hypothetical protein ACE5ER_08675 [Nitrospinaceae bacterium]